MSAAAPETPDAARPTSPTDWRAFRARLASQQLFGQSPHRSDYGYGGDIWAHRLWRVERGAVLVASRTHTWPPAFSHLRDAVVLVTDVGADGVCGLLLNRPTARRVRAAPAVLARVGGPFRENVVHRGGDCSAGSLEMLHGVRTELCDGAEMVVPGVFRGGFNASRRLVVEGVVDADSFRFFVAYSKWTWSGLHDEMHRGAWHMVSCSPQIILQRDTESLWRNVMSMISAT